MEHNTFAMFSDGVEFRQFLFQRWQAEQSGIMKNSYDTNKKIFFIILELVGTRSSMIS